MEMSSGSCRLGLWYVHVYHNGNTDSPDPVSQQPGFRGMYRTLSSSTVPAAWSTSLTFDTPALHGDEVYPAIYRAVRKIPYGSTVTYGEIAHQAGTSPRVVGQAMARNTAPLVIPCHRVVAADGIGGFSPSVEIKEALLALEKKALRKLQLDMRIKPI